MADFSLPKDHQPGLRVPKGGSSCATCKYLGKDGSSCGNAYFQKWNGSPKLPAPADEYCSDWYEPAEGAMAADKPGPLVILVRHGETALNRSAGKGASANEKIRGWLDVPLDQNGVKQAAEAARTLSKEYTFADVVTSPLSRAVITARYIAAMSKAPLRKDPNLKPWDVGQFAGKPVARVLPAMEKLVAHPDVPAPGGEAFEKFANRFLSALADILEEAKREGKDVCVVSHTRNLQLCKAWLAAGAKRDLTYDPEKVNDYSDEVATGDWLTMRAA